MRVVFMGTPVFAVPCLKALLKERLQVAGVVTQPDRPKGRGQKYIPSAVKEEAVLNGLDIYQPLNIKDSEFIRLMEELSPEVIVVVAFGRILPKIILDLPLMGCINVHASLLPQYRGAAPIHRAIMNGEKITGITTMLINESLDSGDILLQEAVPIHKEDTVGTLHDRLASLGAQLLVKTLQLMETGDLIPVPQDHSKATYARMISSEDEVLDWNAPATTIFNHVRGMDPWPGAKTSLDEKLLKIWRVEAVENESSKEGTIPGQVVVSGPEGLVVQANHGLVDVKELQLQGGKRLPAVDFLRGRPVRTGTVLG
ncbi:MAG TPA: methionyl-tRNA formyltransferase [Desulfotomaculum sp.]|nr:MAG: Methionyl-tRNA formyltransferase [Desulfotomaculum sp. 46_80]KUK85085.1 MAG: Methionyl-tRNA formyltransferase [Desulfofundulus kuznetsovii]HAG09935.1 methionyl-tRNA formyltransferase [Desulfotomaculum sp.]HBY04643.1 methionyl-tRNA formyltransferase [Desulfotomaculum sp.]